MNLDREIHEKVFGSLGPVVAYSSDMTAAWRVVDALKDSEGIYGFSLEQDQGELLEWTASFGNGKYFASETHPAQAICMAALAAIKEKK